MISLTQGISGSDTVSSGGTKLTKNQQIWHALDNEKER